MNFEGNFVIRFEFILRDEVGEQLFVIVKYCSCDVAWLFIVGDRGSCVMVMEQ